MAGILDGLFNAQGALGASGILGNLPPWMQPSPLRGSELPSWLTGAMLGAPGASQGFPQSPQEAAALPPNAQPASLSPQQAPSRPSIFTPPDSNPDSPPLRPQQAPAMNAMAQAPQGMPSMAGGIAGAAQGLGGMFDSLVGIFEGGQGKRASTAAALTQMGVNPQIAQAMARDKTLMALLGPSMVGGGSTQDIKEFEYAKRSGFNGTFLDWMAAKRAGGGEYGMTPIWGEVDGKPALIQLGKNGTPIQPKLPDGFSIARDPIKVEGPTGTALLDPQTRQQVGFIPKDVAGAAREKALGGAQGDAAVALPQVVATGERTLKQIDALEKHPGLETATGLSGKVDPRNYIAGTDASNFEIRRQQLVGGTFLEAYQSLRGGGAITEIEGQKAEAAIARMSRAQSSEEFKTALNEYKDIVRQGIARAKAKASGDFTPLPSPSVGSGWSDVGGGIRIREKQ